MRDKKLKIARQEGEWKESGLPTMKRSDEELREYSIWRRSLERRQDRLACSLFLIPSWIGKLSLQPKQMMESEKRYRNSIIFLVSFFSPFEME